MKPRLLDLFCGAGGCTKGYQRAGFYVIGVDNRPQPNYCGDEFVQADALWILEVLTGQGSLCPSDTNRYWLDDFDVIHASPPCQAYSAMKTMPNAGQHADLIPETRRLLKPTALPYVIENVPGARSELVDPVTICGTSVGLANATHDLARHRLFETNWPLMVPPCSHGSRPVVGIYGDHVRDRRRIEGHADRGRDIGIKNEDKLRFGREVMGIDWMTWTELSQAIPPAYTELIGHQLLQHVERRAREPEAVHPLKEKAS